MKTIAQLLRDKRVIVCCGAGGVGKTTVSASLAIAAAQSGRRVLVVTIDPSKRLAETLGVDRNPVEPVSVSEDFASIAGLKGSLSAWMLDPQLVADRVVKTFSKDATEAHTLLNNNIYRNVAAMVAGMQEYTAVQALYEFVQNDEYDLVILDTPPSRDALRFLDAPVRASSFLDRRIFSLFVPGEGSLIRRMATKLVEKVMDVAFGYDTRTELQQFLTLFGALLSQLNHNQTEMQSFFASDAVTFLLVTSPAPEARTEAQYFEHRAGVELGMDVSGFILNRSLASHRYRKMPSHDELGLVGGKALSQALKKLKPLAQREMTQVEADHQVALDISAAGRPNSLTCVLPNLGADASTIPGLVSLAEAVISPQNLIQPTQKETT